MRNRHTLKEVSSAELTDMYIERVEKYDDQINAVVVRDLIAAVRLLKKPMPHWPAATSLVLCTACR